MIRGRGRTRRQPGSMNKTEAAYAATLELRKLAGEVVWYAYEPWKFKLADRTFITPDFGVMLADGALEVHEVKGFMEDDAAVKLKVAAEIHFMFRWVVVRKIKGVWSFDEL